MKTSCINHPPSERLVIIRQWQLKFCDNNIVQAALLSFFEYWHNIKTEIYANNQAQGKQVSDDDLVQHHTEDELIGGILHIAKSPKTIRAATSALAEKYVISIITNPKSRHGYDHTKHFRFHPEPINEWLRNFLGQPQVNLPNRRGKFTETIPETTSEITSEKKNTHSECKKDANCACDFDNEFEKKAWEWVQTNKSRVIAKLTAPISENNEHDKPGEPPTPYNDTPTTPAPMTEYEEKAWKWAQADKFWVGRITHVEQLRVNLQPNKSFLVQFTNRANNQPNTPTTPISSALAPEPNNDKIRRDQAEKRAKKSAQEKSKEERIAQSTNLIASWDTERYNKEYGAFLAQMDSITKRIGTDKVTGDINKEHPATEAGFRNYLAAKYPDHFKTSPGLRDEPNPNGGLKKFAIPASLYGENYE